MDENSLFAGISFKLNYSGKKQENDIIKSAMKRKANLMYTSVTTDGEQVYVGCKDNVGIIATNNRIHIYGNPNKIDSVKTDLFSRIDELRVQSGFQYLIAKTLGKLDLESTGKIERNYLDNLTSVPITHDVRGILRDMVEGPSK